MSVGREPFGVVAGPTERGHVDPNNNNPVGIEMAAVTSEPHHQQHNWWESEPTNAPTTEHNNDDVGDAVPNSPFGETTEAVTSAAPAAATAPPATTPTNNNNTNTSNNNDDTLPEVEEIIILPDNLSVTGPMEDLPRVRPPELKIIGRCVSFLADCVEHGEIRDYYYQGMVAQITKDTVTMMEVLKFTADGFEQYRKANKGGNNTTAITSNPTVDEGGRGENNTATYDTNNNNNNNSISNGASMDNNANASNVHTAAESMNHSRVVAIGTPLPRRERRRRGDSTAPTDNTNSAGVSMGSASAVWNNAMANSTTTAHNNNSNSSSSGGRALSSTYHPSGGPTASTTAANHFGLGTTEAPIANAEFQQGLSSLRGGVGLAGETISSMIHHHSTDGSPLYDYATYNQANYYVNSSTMMPDLTPGGGEANPNNNNNINTTRPPPNAVTVVPPPLPHTSLFSVLPTPSPMVVASPNDPTQPVKATDGNLLAKNTWSPSEPLAHFKFMTFARRKIRKVEFSTDHPMAGLLAPYYISYWYKTGWEAPVSQEGGAFEGANNIGDVAVPTLAGNNNNGPAATPARPLSAQETARQAKERAKRKWQAQQAVDKPIPMENIYKSSRRGREDQKDENNNNNYVVGCERNTRFPFMGINLRVCDPAGYKIRKDLYRVAMRKFLNDNERVREIAPHLFTEDGQGPFGEEDAESDKSNTAHGPSAAGALRGPPLSQRRQTPSPPVGASSSSSSSDDEVEEERAGGSAAPSTVFSSPQGGVSVGDGDERGPLSPIHQPIRLRHQRTQSHSGGPTGSAALSKANGRNKRNGWIPLRCLRSETLARLMAEGAPQRPSAYEYPTTLDSIYSEPKWRAGNPFILQDLSRVRMFIRRYIVHTSQGNNQRKIPLIAFVSQRCPWPNPPEELLKELLYVDLRGLLKVEAELVAKQQNARGTAAVNGGSNVNATMRNGAMALNGEEMSPGRMLLATTGIIVRTTYLAIGHIAVAIGLLLYAASAFSSLEKYFVSNYAGNIAGWVVAAAASHLFLGAATGFHSMKMQVPVVLIHAAPRILMAFVSLLLLILSFAQLMVIIEGKKNLLKGVSQEEAWMELARAGSDDLCNFMTRKQCNGYNVPCTASSFGQCVSSCLSMVLVYGGNTCVGAVNDAVVNALLPILVIVVICMIMVLIDIGYMARYVTVSMRLAMGMRDPLLA